MGEDERKTPKDGGIVRAIRSKRDLCESDSEELAHDYGGQELLQSSICKLLRFKSKGLEPGLLVIQRWKTNVPTQSVR